MKQVSVTQLKNQLSHYLRLVKRGETIEILEHSVPVARLEGLRGRAERTDVHLERLRREGIVRRPRRESGVDIVNEPPVPCSGDAAQAVVDERGSR